MKYFTWTIFSLILLNVSMAGAIERAKLSETHKPFIDVDLSGGAGNYNGQFYTETHLGLNLNFTDWLTWRNSIFKRISSGTEVSGLDSSARFSLDESGYSIYGGPGYRWASNSAQNALFAEAGADIRIANIRIGGGVKYLSYDRPGSDAYGSPLKKDDTSFFFSISGGIGMRY